jgi:hypothetical protein
MKLTPAPILPPLPDAEYAELRESIREFGVQIPPRSSICIECHWRNGDFLTGKHRSTIAQYILNKLRDYIRQFKWTVDQKFTGVSKQMFE